MLIDSLKSHEKPMSANASDGIKLAVESGQEQREFNQYTVRASASQRDSTDAAAVEKGQLPPKPVIVDREAQGGDRKGFDGTNSVPLTFDKNGTHETQISADGSVRTRSENLAAGTGKEETRHPDRSRELTTWGGGALETKKFDKDGNLRSDLLNQERAPGDKFNATFEKSWDAKGKLYRDNSRWQDKQGQWHEDNQMNLPDGTTIHQKMDGERTETKTVNPDGSWSNTVKTMNVDMVDSATGKHYKTMTIQTTESPQK